MVHKSSYVNSLNHYYLDSIATGSRVICNPAPTDTDEDYILLVDTHMTQILEDKLLADGFESNSKEYENVRAEFKSYRRDELNLIVTTDQDFFEKSWKATWLCKYLNLLNKDHRIAVFRAVREDRWPGIDYDCGAPSSEDQYQNTVEALLGEDPGDLVVTDGFEPQYNDPLTIPVGEHQSSFDGLPIYNTQDVAAGVAGLTYDYLNGDQLTVYNNGNMDVLFHFGWNNYTIPAGGSVTI